MSLLSPCAHCNRHIHVTAPRCPFCSAAMGVDRTHAGFIAAAAAVAITATASCMGGYGGPPPDHSPRPHYEEASAPVVDAGAGPDAAR